MKLKNILAVVLIIFLANFSMLSFSAERELASSFARITTNALGYNFIVRKTAEKLICKALRKSVKGDYKISIDSFSGIDLKRGKFRGAIIKGNNLSIDDELFISSLMMKTLSDYNYIKYDKKKLKFMTEVPMSYSVVITESDFNKSLASNKILRAFTVDLPLVKVDSLKSVLADDKISFISKVRFPFCKPIKMTVSTGLKIEDGKIVFDNIDTSSMKSELAGSVIEYMNSHNLLTEMNLYIFDDTTTFLEVKNIKIVNGKMYIDGIVTLNKVQENGTKEEETK